MIIIQARLNATRLPGKVFKPLAGKPMLEWVVNRASQAGEVVVATPDDEIVELCKLKGWAYFKGSEHDVLDRYYQAAKFYHADTIVRITADCPLIDPAIIRKVISALENDYSSNINPVRTYPRGLDCEAFTFEALERAWRKDNQYREHVTPYIWKHPELFKLKCITNDTDYSHMRWTVDTVEDYQLMQKLCESFDNDKFGWQEVVSLLSQHPDWFLINNEVRQKEV